MPIVIQKKILWQIHKFAALPATNKEITQGSAYFLIKTPIFSLSKKAPNWLLFLQRLYR